MSQAACEWGLGHEEHEMRILCATDLLPKSEAALERAAMIARRLRAHLCIVHIVASVQDERNARTALVRIENRLRSLMESDGISPSVILSVAFPAEAVLGAIKRMEPDLLVMGTSGYRRFRRALLGSTASLVLDAASCDVLVVPQGIDSAHRRAVACSATDRRPAMSACIH